MFLKMDFNLENEDAIVDNVTKVFTNVSAHKVYALIDSVTNLGSHQDDVETSTQKICNFLLESDDKYASDPPVVSISDSGQVLDPKSKCHELSHPKTNGSSDASVSNTTTHSLTSVSTSVDPQQQTRDVLEKEVHTSGKSTEEVSVSGKSTEEIHPSIASCSHVSLPNNENRDPNKGLTSVTFECACCYDEADFEEGVQCSEGHLFCRSCLRRYTQESVYGQGQVTLYCMAGNCGTIFTIGELKRSLPADLFEKYEDRVRDECINSAGLENFIRCKFCNYGGELDPLDQYFACSECGKRFCRHCGKLYEVHRGVPCNEIEKDQEKDIRTTYEEKMSEAKIRICEKCKSKFTKGSGCNKITCRCGGTMCFICRISSVNYDHFCQHERRFTDEKCAQCDKPCNLWSNAEEDDRLAIEDLKIEANQARTKEGYTKERAIGVANDIPHNNVEDSDYDNDSDSEDEEDYLTDNDEEIHVLGGAHAPQQEVSSDSEIFPDTDVINLDQSDDGGMNNFEEGEESLDLFEGEDQRDATPEPFLEESDQSDYFYDEGQHDENPEVELFLESSDASDHFDDQYQYDDSPEMILVQGSDASEHFDDPDHEVDILDELCDASDHFDNPDYHDEGHEVDFLDASDHFDYQDENDESPEMVLVEDIDDSDNDHIEVDLIDYED